MRLFCASISPSFLDSEESEPSFFCEKAWLSRSSFSMYSS